MRFTVSTRSLISSFVVRDTSWSRSPIATASIAIEAFLSPCDTMREIQTAPPTAINSAAIAVMISVVRAAS